MNKKLGPLPAWAWIVIAGGTIGMVVFLKKAKETAGTTGEVIPEVAGQAIPQGEGGGGGGSAAGSLEAFEAKNSEEIGQLREEIKAGSEHTETTQTGLGAGIGEVIQAKEALEALGLVRPLQGATTEPSSNGNSPVKEATGKGQAFPLTSTRGKYKETTVNGHQAHEYAHAVTGGIGPKHNKIVLGGPAKVTHAAAGSHAPAHVSKPPAHDKAAKPVVKRGAPAPAAHHPAAKPAPHPAPKAKAKKGKHG